jgi:hypothetical protein
MLARGVGIIIFQGNRAPHTVELSETELALYGDEVRILIFDDPAEL